MNGYLILVVIICLAAAFAYVNHRYIKLPFVIGIFLQSTIVSILVLTGKLWGVQYYDSIRNTIASIDISRIILDILLGFLLFAGSLHTQWSGIKNQLKAVTTLSVAGVICSTGITALLVYGICNVLSVKLSFLYCLIFGALISPTDPIAVLGILKTAGVPKKIESIIVGESLFNDGVGVVVFVTLLRNLSSGSDDLRLNEFLLLFLQDAVGGLLFGLFMGYLLHRLLRSIDNYGAEVLITIAFVMAGYRVCSFLNVSGALAMVIMGLFVGNFRRNKAMSDTTLEYVLKFWEIVDVVLNAVLFIGIAFVLVLIEFKTSYLLLGIASIFAVLLSRVFVVYVPKVLLPKWVNVNSKEARIIVWGGLRGGLSIALVLSLPEGDQKQLLVIVTYCVVIFSILFQGLTIERLAKSTPPLTSGSKKHP